MCACTCVCVCKYVSVLGKGQGQLVWQDRLCGLRVVAVYHLIQKYYVYEFHHRYSHVEYVTKGRSRTSCIFHAHLYIILMIPMSGCARKSSWCVRTGNICSGSSLSKKSFVHSEDLHQGLLFHQVSKERIQINLKITMKLTLLHSFCLPWDGFLMLAEVREPSAWCEDHSVCCKWWRVLCVMLAQGSASANLTGNKTKGRGLC